MVRIRESLVGLQKDSTTPSESAELVKAWQLAHNITIKNRYELFGKFNSRIKKKSLSLIWIYQSLFFKI